MEVNHFILESVTSTNSWAKENRKKFNKEELTVIIAHEQREGYGTHNTSWFSEKNRDITMTFYFNLKKEKQNLSQLLILSVISLFLELNPKIKWPNDLLINNKKMAGALCEVEGDEVFLGIGVNVNSEKFPCPATSLKIESGHEWNLEKLIEKIIENFSKNLELFTKVGFTPFLTQLNDLLAFKNQEIVVTTEKEEIRGFLVGINNEGAILLKTENNYLKTIFSGKIKL